MKVQTLLIILGFILSTPTYAVDNIVLWNRTYDKQALRELIRIAADLSVPEYGPYTLNPSKDIEQGRAFISLAEGELLNVMVAAISSEREKLGLPIYVPLDRGLLGFRLCLQHENARSLGNIGTLNDLMVNNIVVGIGSHWPDRSILESNGLNVMHSPVYEQLFAMLARQRFDCFLRSMHEVDSEIERFADLNLKADENISIIYPQADFAFVSIRHPRLHERLTYGLQRAIEQGLYKEHFEKFYAETLQKHHLYERKLIILENTDLSIEAMDAINQFGLASFALRASQRNSMK